MPRDPHSFSVSDSDPMGSVVASCLDIALQMIYVPEVQYSFTQALTEIDQAFVGNRKEAASWLTEDFFPAMMDEFPPLVIDWMMQSGKYAAVTYYASFNRKNYANNIVVSLNASFVVAMMNAFKEDKMSAVQDWMFIFANILIHEMGHIMSRHRYDGRENTPEHLPPRGSAARRATGRQEGGKYLEMIIHSGQHAEIVPPNTGLKMEDWGLIMRNTTRWTDDNGIDWANDLVWRIRRRTISDALDRSK